MRDKKKALQADQANVIVACMDLECVLLAPALYSSAALYYKTKQAVHSFEIHNLVSRALWHEGEGGLTANEF